MVTKKISEMGDEENALKSEVAALKAMLEKLMEGNPNTKKEYSIDEYENDEQFESIKIAAEDYIKVMSLCPYELNLSTLGFGKGKRFRFDKMYEIKRIMYSDLVEIIESNRKFVEDGFFIIMDDRVVRKNGLNETYEKILTKEKIEDIINNSKDAADLFKSANTRQREFIQDMLIGRIRDGVSVDLNMIDRISRIAGINIAERGEEAKSYSQLIPA